MLRDENGASPVIIYRHLTLEELGERPGPNDLWGSGSKDADVVKDKQLMKP
jgi:hypothetical protein